MTPGDRRRVADSLPPDLGVLPSEGTPHERTVRQVCNTLDDFFARNGRPVVIAANLAVYYPREPAFAPDILAVVDVGMHERMRWLVSEEERGIDLALEILVQGDRRKDLERNVERYARLGIREYFVFDRSRLRLSGYRLAPTRRYEPVTSRFGLLHSEVLGLDIQQQGTGLRFYCGGGWVQDLGERITTLEGMLKTAESRIRDESLLREQEARMREEAARMQADAEAKLAAALAEIERLRQERS